MKTRTTLLLLLALANFTLLSCGAGQVPDATPTPIITGIEGRVYFADTDEPIPDVNILLNTPQMAGRSQQNPELTIAKTKTDAQGNYSFTDIVPGTYVVSLSMVSETKVSSIEVTVNDYISYFEGTSKDGKTILYIVEPEFVVLSGVTVQEDFIVHK